MRKKGVSIAWQVLDEEGYAGGARTEGREQAWTGERRSQETNFAKDRLA